MTNRQMHLFCAVMAQLFTFSALVTGSLALVFLVTGQPLLCVAMLANTIVGVEFAGRARRDSRQRWR